MLKDFLEPAADDRGGEMSAALRDRLKSIPRTVAVCRDRNRLYQMARRRARGGAEDASMIHHLTECERCAELYETLATTFEEPLPPPSGKLVADLRSIAGRPANLLPEWITDSRYATAACVLLAMFLTVFADDSAARLADTTSRVGSRTSVWIKTSQEMGRALWDSMATELDESYLKSQEHLQDFGESCKELFHETVRTLGALVINDPKTSDGGESDGNAEPDAP